MNLSVGIVGLPNVGKSTLFNALLRRQASSAEASAGQAGDGGARIGNYPFTTIEPNVGIVPVPDERLTKLQEIIGPGTPIVPATVQFVDIAGLVKGAAEGAGLGNKFLSHIREVDLICEVVRAFPDGDIIREGSSDPKSDIEVINTELVLADLQSLEKMDVKKLGERAAVVEQLRNRLNKGELAGTEGKEFQLLTSKKIIYVYNVNTTTKWPSFAEATEGQGPSIVIDAKLEAELSILEPDEQEEYLASLGVKDSGVSALIRKAYATLGLISFLTAGVKEVRAWPIPAGTKAPQAAGTIHTDFEKAFIKAEVVDYKDFIEYNGWQGSREKGRARIEGKDYLIKDGDVVEFKVNA